MLIQYDLLLKSLENILEKGTKCEDNKLMLSNKVKYDVFNLVYELDSKWVKRLFEEIEYKEIED